MKHISSALLVVAQSAPHLLVAAQVSLPADVLAFSRERESCDHWRGEAPYDSERAVEINVGICGSCIGTDEKLDTLKIKYKQRDDALLTLNEFEPNIEGLKGARAASFCKAAYKKHFKIQEKHEQKGTQ